MIWQYYANMKTLFTVVLIIPLIGLARGGTDSGGGDPRASNMLANMRHVCEWMIQDNRLQHKAQACLDEVYDISESLNNNDRRPRIYTVDKDQEVNVKDLFGTPKVAFTDPDGRIRIAPTRWNGATCDNKMINSAIEMALLLGLDIGRYDIEAMFRESKAFQNASQLCSLPTPLYKECVFKELGNKDYIYKSISAEDKGLRRVHVGARIEVLSSYKAYEKQSDGSVVTFDALKLRVLSNPAPSGFSSLNQHPDAFPGEELRADHSLIYFCQQEGNTQRSLVQDSAIQIIEGKR